MGEPVIEAGSSTAARQSLVEIGADVPWTDIDAVAAARDHPLSGAGRLGDLVEWLAATQGTWPPHAPARARLLILGQAGEPVAAIADSVGASIRNVNVPADIADAFAAGVAAADSEVEAGAELIVLADPDISAAAGVVVGLVTGTEPVALLPRGAEAVDTATWIARAEHLRDTRRRVGSLRNRPDELLAASGGPALATSAGIVMRSSARRTPLVLDGTSAVAAALLCYDVQALIGRWLWIADASPDPVHTRATAELGQQPLLELGTQRGDGIAGLLCLALLRAATALVKVPT